MSSDDELLHALGAALAPEHREPPVDRVKALRAAAQAHSMPRLSDRRRASRRGLRRVVAVAGAAAAVSVLVAGAVTFSDRGANEDLLAGGIVEFELTLTSADGKTTAAATGVRTGIGRIVRLRTDELPILPKGELYELWFVGPGDTPRNPNRISAGTFHPDEQGRSHVDLTAAVDPALYPAISITAEPGDGDPKPTGPEVLRATIKGFEPVSERARGDSKPPTF